MRERKFVKILPTGKNILELARSMRSKKRGGKGTVEDTLTLEAKEVANEGEFVDERGKSE